MMEYAEEGELSIEDIAMLAESECAELRRQILQLRPYWIQRLPDLPMYSLGAATYLDMAQGESHYVETAARYNPILQQHFAPLYRRLEEVLSRRLGGPVAYPPHKALPGFHIFLAHPAFTQGSASIHADLQYRQTDWSWARSISQPISFTLAISLPSCGSGVNVWNVSVTQLDGLPRAEAARVLRERGGQFFEYRLGHLTLQFGHLMHQIARPLWLVEGDQRLTFQGHALLCDGSWQLYW